MARMIAEKDQRELLAAVDREEEEERLKQKAISEARRRRRQRDLLMVRALVHRAVKRTLFVRVGGFGGGGCGTLARCTCWFCERTQLAKN